MNTKKTEALKLAQKEKHMNEGEKAYRDAIFLLRMVIVTTWFNMACIAWYHIKEWFY